MAKKILITGGTGFLGVHLARSFLKQGCKVTVLDLEDLDAKDLIGKVTYAKGDIRDKQAVDAVMKGQEYVIHAAAALPIQRKEAIFSSNVNGTRTVLQSALQNRVKRLIFISTTAVYGIAKELPETEEMPLNPIGYYGMSKAEGEQLCLEYQKKGLSVIILRPTTFLGTERLGIFTLWFEAIYSGHRLFILGNGNNKHQLLSVADLADAIEKSLSCKATGEIINLGAKEFGTWRTDLSYVIQKAGSQSKITSLPTFPSQYILQILEALHLSPIAAFHYKTLPINYYVSIRKAEKLLNWHPIKSNKELFLESYLWYKKNRDGIRHRVGNTHRTGWNFKLLNLASKF